MLGECESASAGFLGSFSTPLKWISARLLHMPLTRLPLSTCSSCILAGIFVSASISTRRVAATGSVRYSWPETWTVIVNLRQTSRPAGRFSDFLGSRRTACFFVTDPFGALGVAFFGAAFLLGTAFFGAAFWGTAFFPFIAALTATSPLVVGGGVLPSITPCAQTARRQFAISTLPRSSSAG